MPGSPASRNTRAATGERVVEPGGELGELAVAARRRRVRVVGARPLAGSAAGTSERRVLGEDRPLELAQPLSRLDPELLDQRPARVLVGLQRVGLAVGAVEGEHQLRAQPLAVGVLADQGLELADDLGVATERELRLDELLQRRDPQVLEPGDLALREGLVRRGPPAAGRATATAPPRAPARRGPGGRRASSVRPSASEPLEAVRVEAVGIERRARSRARG